LARASFRFFGEASSERDSVEFRHGTSLETADAIESIIVPEPNSEFGLKNREFCAKIVDRTCRLEKIIVPSLGLTRSIDPSS
jgi:hypothetical protein